MGDVFHNLLSYNLVRAEGYGEPLTVRAFSEPDINNLDLCFRGTWVYDHIPDIDAMKAAFRKLLGYYPPLSGRVHPNGSGIVFSNRGTPFIVKEETSVSVEDIGKTDKWARRFTTPLDLGEVKRGNIAPMNVTLSLLKNGSVLSVQCSHGCVDCVNFYTIVNDWSKLCRGEDIVEPVFEQSLFSTAQSSAREDGGYPSFAQGWKSLFSGSIIKMFSDSLSGIALERTGAFHFSSAAIKRLRDKISSECSFECTTGIALSAYIGKMFAILNNLPDSMGYKQAVTIDLRGRLDGIPAAFFGNASMTVPTRPYKRTATLSEIAQIVYDLLQKIIHQSPQELAGFLMNNPDNLGTRLPDMPIDTDSFSLKRPLVFYNHNFSTLPIYSVDFGKGRPVLSLPHNLQNHQILIWPVSLSENDGVEVYFSGLLARQIKKLNPNDPWMLAMRKMER
ncbi:MAG TPA: hypothetical protein DDZ96_01755 [Porphyromonadaceae bacterium]|jgi:hypothetical protein|nr:hypothetical protein [Porphyromonadaceae bacterium]HBL32531.1 hypothetical protein [Porphyromonadaceae bacterium]HBX20963.1 hypothetical protein [Porphyromonadaceae bacterium]HCM20530.1 hypothetical protein [Porphyromonadaceae bacterium]